MCTSTLAALALAASLIWPLKGTAACYELNMKTRKKGVEYGYGNADFLNIQFFVFVRL